MSLDIFLISLGSTNTKQTFSNFSGFGDHDTTVVLGISTIVKQALSTYKVYEGMFLHKLLICLQQCLLANAHYSALMSIIGFYLAMYIMLTSEVGLQTTLSLFNFNSIATYKKMIRHAVTITAQKI